MHELRRDAFYNVLKEYDRLAVDYCLIESDAPHQGYASHKEAVLFAMKKLQQEYDWITIDIDKAEGEEIPAEILFAAPEEPPAFDGGKIAYLHAFLQPPHGTGPVIRDGKILRKKYSEEDFTLVNKALFPEGTEQLEVYDWSSDWSSYFAVGREWWGCLCISIYDRQLARYAVILAAETD